MQNKRGQVTIFIIIAILIIGIVALFFTLKSNVGESEVYNPEVAPIANFVEECIDEVSIEVIQLVAEGGGYYYPPRNLATDSLGIAYHRIGDKSYVRSKSAIEKEISDYISEGLFLCTKNFKDFSSYDVVQGNIRTNTEILDESVSVEVNYPLTISKGDSTNRLNVFKKDIQIPFGRLYNAANEFVEQERKASFNGICITCLYEVSKKYNIYADSFHTGEDTVVFLFLDENEEGDRDTKSIKYLFANIY